MTGRVTIFWLVALVVSSLALVDVRNRYLLLFDHEEHLVGQKDALHVEWGGCCWSRGRWPRTGGSTASRGIVST